MPLKLTVEKLEDLAEPLRSLYKAGNDGGFILDVEGGVVAKSVHDGFRNNNIALQKRLKDLGELTPETLQELRNELDQTKADLAAARKGKDQEAEARIKAIQDGLQKKIDEASKAADGYRGRLEKVLIDGEIAKFAATVGAIPEAIDDITARVRSQFRVGDDDQPYALDTNGQKRFAEGGEVFGISHAVRGLVKTAPHLFQRSQGSGASNTHAGGGRSNTTNPWKKETWNVTEQMRIEKADKAEATRMAAEAGTKLE